VAVVQVSLPRATSAQVSDPAATSVHSSPSTLARVDCVTEALTEEDITNVTAFSLATVIAAAIDDATPRTRESRPDVVTATDAAAANGRRRSVVAVLVTAAEIDAVNLAINDADAETDAAPVIDATKASMRRSDAEVVAAIEIAAVGCWSVRLSNCSNVPKESMLSIDPQLSSCSSVATVKPLSRR